MLVLNGLIAQSLRQKYIQTFIQTGLDYFSKYIQKTEQFKDGWCYTGYLWDCFDNFFLKSMDECEDFLSTKRNLYVFWDIHSSERILIPNYWKYPKDSILALDSWNYDRYHDTLPEDIYFFDDSLTWSIAYTHEETDNGDRFCYFAKPKGKTGDGSVS